MNEYYVIKRDDEYQIISVTTGAYPLYGYGSWNQYAGPFASWKEAEDSIPSSCPRVLTG